MAIRVLVTGGAGFIGSHLCERLLSHGFSIVVLDNFNSYYSPIIKQKNISDIRGFISSNQIDPGFFSVVEGDILDTGLLRNIFTSNNIEVVIHLAAMAGVRPSIEKPELYCDVNIRGTLNLLEMCREYKVRKLIFASSSSVYGNNKKVPFSESDNVDYPISPYAATKKSGELLCNTYHRLYNIDCACMRFFTVYGPRQRPDLAIHKFTDMIYRGLPVPFYGDGSTERDYTFIDDIVDGLIKTADWILKGGGYEIINLGESKPISLSYMISVIESIVGKQAIISKLPMQPGDVDRTYADVSKAERLVGYKPKTDFREGVQKFFDWYMDTGSFLKNINKI